MSIRSSRIVRTLFVAFLAAAFLLAAALLGRPQVDSARAAECPNSGGRPYAISTKQAREAVTCLINERRRDHGRSALMPRRSLRSAAARHSSFMERHHCFAHRCAGEGGLQSRVNKTSYLPCNCSWGLGENIAWAKSRKSKSTPRGIVRAWMHSSAHRGEMLNGSFDHVGVGVVWGGVSSSRAKAGIYTADFGFKR
jgi:uncharacterized protein YkwD